MQHLRGRGLLLQRFGQIVGALAQLVEQAGVLDGDNRLGGEVLDQLDLLVGERSNLLAVYADARRPARSSLIIGTTSKVRAPPSSTPATASGSPSR